MTLSATIVSVMMGALGFLGLLMASRAADTVFYCTGFAIFAFSVLMIFGLIARSTGHRKEN